VPQPQRLDATTRPSPDDYHPPHTLPEERLHALEEAARWLYDNTPYAILCGETLADLQYKPGGTAAWWMRLVEDPGAAHDFLAKACEAALDQLVALNQAIGRYCEALLIADDIGDVRGVTIGPNLWRAIYRPHYQRLFQGWHQRTAMKIYLHSCGSIVDILPDLVACGVDILNPVQISARGMEPERLVETFGRQIVFSGGAFDAVLTPPATQAEEVYAAVRSNIETFKRHGRYLFAGVHNIPGDTPEAHLRAILQAYQDARDYAL
jgi:uroporphyrinogen decarboxylase